MAYHFDRRIICPWDPTATERRIREYESYYRIKYEICADAHPNSILEIGVRAGYSAYFFLQAAPNAFYLGIDADNGKHGGHGSKSYLPWAQALLEELGVAFRLDWPVDSQVLDAVPEAEFYHIDGDHTTKGCLHDLELCWKSAPAGAVLLIDDYDYIRDVRRAVDQWAEAHPEAGKEYLSSLRGEVIFRKPGKPHAST